MTTKPPENEPKPPEPVVDPVPPVVPPVTEPAPPQTPAVVTAPPDPTNWEESYKGLQKVVAKKDSEITEATQRLETLAGQFEILKNTSTLSQAEKAKLEGELGKAKTSLDGLKVENDDLKTTLSQKEMIMKDFPTLSPLANYIPAGESDEEYRKNAEAFALSLGAYTKQAVAETLDGASITQPPGPDDVVITPDREDELISTINSLAGIEGKEKEFDEANDELLKLQSAKDPKIEFTFD